jgi:hypothetical protein
MDLKPKMGSGFKTKIGIWIWNQNWDMELKPSMEYEFKSKYGI